MVQTTGERWELTAGWREQKPRQQHTGLTWSRRPHPVEVGSMQLARAQLSHLWLRAASSSVALTSIVSRYLFRSCPGSGRGCLAWDLQRLHCFLFLPLPPHLSVLCSMSVSCRKFRTHRVNRSMVLISELTHYSYRCSCH